ncbi:MAG TPA: tetratricopeptide repeat protein [Longimicrobiales bacterium]|nr:tetratricopeptide repeat protein [Longimicrobiales bacterium]
MSAPKTPPRRLFAAELARPEAEMDLARAALLVAQEEYPQIPVELYLARLDQMAEEVQDRLADETAPPVVLCELLEMLFVRRGFAGNRTAYYDPRNSFLNDVLDRSTGIPLTLGMVLLEVGWRLGLPLEGVNFPGHFLVRYRGDAVDLLIDPFDGGKVRFADQAQELLDQLYGGMVRVQESFLRRADRRDMLVRLLSNLKGVYVNVGDHARALAVVERLLLVQPDSRSDLRARGLILARMGRRDEAVAQLQEYLDLTPGAGDVDRIRSMMDDLQAGRAISEERDTDA